MQSENSYSPIGFLRHFSLLLDILRNFFAGLLPHPCIFADGQQFLHAWTASIPIDGGMLTIVSRTLC